MIGEDTLDIDGQVALVTGAGKGVGRAIALELAKNNAGGIAVNDFDAGRADAVVAEIHAMGVKAVSAVFDVTDRDAIAAGYARVAEELGATAVLASAPIAWTCEPGTWMSSTGSVGESTFSGCPYNCSKGFVGKFTNATLSACSGPW